MYLAVIAAAVPGCAANRGSDATEPRSAVVQLCADFSVNQAGPHCLRLLTPDEARQRNHAWRLTYEGGRVVRAAAQNGLGHFSANRYGEVEYAYVYDRGYLIERRAFDRSANLLERSRYSRDWTRVDYVDEWGRPKIHGDSYYISEVRVLDRDGFVAETQYIGLDGLPAKSELGSYVDRHDRDAAHRISRTCHFDATRKPRLNRWGIHCSELDRDGLGNVTVERFLDEERRPTENIIGRHRLQTSLDAYGNTAREVWYGLSGSPYRWTDTPGRCSTVVYHVLGGALVGGDCLNEQGGPARFVEGSTYWRDTVDSLGRTKESRSLGPDGAPMAIPSAALVILEFGKNDFVTERRFFLGSERPGQNAGPAIVRYVPEEHGLVKFESYFDAAKHQTTHWGCAHRQFEYDGYRQLTKVACLDTQRRPARDHTGTSARHYTYHPNGLLAELRLFDVDGHPAENRDGFSRSTIHYDAQGTETARLFYDLKQQPVALRRFRAIHARLFPAMSGRTSEEREKVVSRLEKARARLIAGEDFEQVALRYADVPVSIKNPGDLGYCNIQKIDSLARQALEPLNVGEISALVEIPGGFFVYQRLE
jgi:hypothetical protein